VLRTSTLLGAAGWEEAVLDDVVGELVTTVVRSGEVVVRAGDPSDDLILVVSGRLRVVLEQADGSETVIAELGRGETVGELGLITGDPRSATVVAIRDAILARLTRESFDALCAKHPHTMMRRFAGGTLRRMLQEARGERLPSSEFRGTLALVAADAQVPLAWFTDELAREFASVGPTLALTAAACDAMLGREVAGAEVPSGEDEAMLVRLLAEQERAHRFLLYRADVERTPWSDRCVRQADHVVLVARAEAAPGDVPLLTSLDRAPEVKRRTSLVLLHEGSTVRPGAAARWEASVAADDLHHVRRAVEDDFGRVARLIAREGVGIVFGGGGARAFAAAGIVHALAEAGSPIDMVCGVSAGAILAGLFAMGLPYEEVLDRSGAASRRIDYTVPVYALTTGRNWSATLTDLFADSTIEDLLLPFFCTSVNLSQARLVVHDRGSLLHAVRASTAIPGILPPVWHEGDLLVDGGLLNNLPIDLARARLGVGRVLAVSVSPERREEHREPFGYHVSGWRALGGRLVRRTGLAIPTTMDLLMQSMLVADARTKRNTVQLADWIFYPPASGYSLMDWDQYRGIAESGYRYAVEALQHDEVRAAVLGKPGTPS
jgi:predicted acylesterase/phospholipase RssA